MISYLAKKAMLPDGWQSNVQIDVDADGFICYVGAEKTDDQANTLPGPVMPSLVNLHSHAFQRAFAGLTEYRQRADDSFWSWRDSMYRFAASMTPDSLQSVATQLYVEMLEGGYTHVCEFHYLHHGAGGTHYQRLSENGGRLQAAAADAGIGLTLMPVLYQRAGFNDATPSTGQRQFCLELDAYLGMLDELQTSALPGQEMAVALHSLRAVSAQSIAELIEQAPQGLPWHIHIAEQQAEVADCLSATGQRPVAWLLDHCPVDHRWCLVHATHLDQQEVVAAAGSGAVAGLCPTTEANLGDGFFPLGDWSHAGGRFGIGSDSHVCRSAAEELRLLEYGQRLLKQQRNVSVQQDGQHTGAWLWRQSAAVSKSISGVSLGRIEPGQRADFLVLQDDDRTSDDGWVDALVFGGDNDAIDQVYCAGRQVVDNGQHLARKASKQQFDAALKKLKEMV